MWAPARCQARGVTLYWYRREFPVGDGCALGPARVAIRSTSWPVRHEKRMLQDRNTDDAYIPYARQEVA
jgi:hypothetical protein